MTEAIAPHVPHIVVLGGGFGGLWATRALKGAAVRITLIDRTNHHLFQPLLYQVATAGLSSSDVAAPLRHILRKQDNVEVRLAAADRIDIDSRQVHLDDDTSLGYDILILATGSMHAYFGHDDWEPFAPGLKTLKDAVRIRRHFLLAFERAEAETDPVKRDAWLSFAVVGGGPTGVELAGTIAEIARHTLRREFRRIDPATAKVRLLEAGPRILSTFPESLSAKARKQLERLGVEVITGKPVTRIDGSGYRLGDEFVAANTVVWAAGVAGSPLAKSLRVPLDRAGRVLVSPDLTVPDHPEIFVVGDLASIASGGKPVPGVAPAAKQMGRYAAHAIRARMDGKPAKPFRYRDYGNLATIGRMAAIVDLHGFRFSGAIAWFFWLIAHIFFLIGFRNRMAVLVNWMWAYGSYERGARIIVGDTSANDDSEHEFLP
ncbi:MAG: NAD(P)/FAD-dependent oxidoreductase [Rudaea sp.]